MHAQVPPSFSLADPEVSASPAQVAATARRLLALGNHRPAVPPQAARRQGDARQTLVSWVQAQSLNVVRHAAALRPFRMDEFGNGDEAPSDAHIEVVNHLIGDLRRGLLHMASHVRREAQAAQAEPTTARLQRLVTFKERAHAWVQAIEKIWDFYLELFGQRQSQYAEWLLSCDRIALDCYQYAYLGCGKARSIPAPPPFSYMRTGFSPATYTRGIPLSKLGKQLNPFPLIQLPYHRLINPWTLGAVLHEVSHNLQNDLGLSRLIPRQIAFRLLKAGLPRPVARVWAGWNRETFADMSGLLLGGPPFIGSLLDILGRSPRATATFIPRTAHPTPYICAFINFELLKRMGFPDQAHSHARLWRQMYPVASNGAIPRVPRATLEQAIPIVVDAICYSPMEPLGNKTLAQVLCFEPKELQMMDEAAGRLAAGVDPGVVPARFLIGAARIALDRRLARPGVIARNFYKALGRR